MSLLSVTPNRTEKHLPWLPNPPPVHFHGFGVTPGAGLEQASYQPTEDSGLVLEVKHPGKPSVQANQRAVTPNPPQFYPRIPRASEKSVLLCKSSSTPKLFSWAPPMGRLAWVPHFLLSPNSTHLCSIPASPLSSPSHPCKEHLAKE